MAQPQVSIKVLLVDTPANEALKRLAKNFKDNAVDIKASLELIKGAVDVVVGAIESAITVVGKWTKASEEGISSENKLIVALSLRTTKVNETAASLEKFNAAMQLTTGTGKLQLQQIETTLLAMGVLPQKLEIAVKGVLGLVASGQSLEGATRLIGKAMQGTGEDTHKYSGHVDAAGMSHIKLTTQHEKGLNALGRYGIHVKSATELMSILEQRFQLAIANAGTLEVRVNILNNVWDQFTRALGAVITNSTVVKGTVTALTEALTAMTKWVQESGLQKFIEAVFRGLADILGTMAEAIAGVLLFFQKSTQAFRVAMAAGKGDLDGVKRILAEDTVPIVPGSLVDMITRLGDKFKDLAKVKAELMGPPPPPPGIKPPPKQGGKEAGDAIQPGLDIHAQMVLEEQMYRDKLKYWEKMARLDGKMIKDQTDGVRVRNEAMMEGLKNDRNIVEKMFNFSVNDMERVKQQEAVLEQGWVSLGHSIQHSIVHMVTGTLEAIFAGTSSLTNAIGKLLGTMLIQLGEAMLAQAAIFAAVAIFTGGSTGPQAAGFAIAGTAAIALGAKLESITSGSGFNPPSASGFSPPSSSPKSNSGGPKGNQNGGSYNNPYNSPASGIGSMNGFTQNQPATVTYNIQFPRGFIVGSDRAVGQEIVRLTDAANTLRGRRGP